MTDSAAWTEEETTVAVAEKPETRKKPKRAPRYHVVLWDDQEHTYAYVMVMLQDLFAKSSEDSFRTAKEVDSRGRAICLTTTLEHAELKRDQILGYGPDPTASESKGSMFATIERVPEDE